MSIFIFGAGFTSRAFLRLMQGQDTAPTIYGTTRSLEKANALSALGATAVLFDGEGFSQEARAA